MGKIRILLSLVLLAGVARAEPSQTFLEQAAAQYADLEFEKALTLLKQAKRQPDNARLQLLRIYHLQGLCQGALRQYDQAKQSFRSVLALDPTFRLGADVSPRVRKPFEELVKAKPQRTSVRLIPPTYAQPDQPLELTARVVNDPVGMVRAIRVWFRAGGQGKFSTLRAKTRVRDGFQIMIPAPLWQGAESQDQVQFYVVAEGEYRAQLETFGNAASPLVLEVKRKPAEPMTGVAAEKSWYQHWWVWAVVGTVVVGAATTTAVLATQEDSSGPFDFTVDFSTQ